MKTTFRLAVPDICGNPAAELHRPVAVAAKADSSAVDPPRSPCAAARMAHRAAATD